MDASNKQPTVAEKFAAVWEKKNAKAARAGGVSLMALSLAACGGSSSTTTTTTDTTTETETPAEPTTPVVTAKSHALATTQDILTGDSFTSANDTVTATSATMTAVDVLVDSTSTDSDTLTIDATGAVATGTIAGIENITINSATAAGVTHNLSGVADGTVTLNMTQVAGATSTTVSNVGTIGVTAGTGFTGAADRITVTQVENATATVTLTDKVENVTLTATNTAATAAETLTLVAAGDVDVTATNAANLNVSGTGKITLNAGSDTLAGKTGTITGSAAQTLIAASADDIDASNVTGFGSVQIDTTTDGDSAFDARKIEGTLILADGAIAADTITIASGTTVEMAGADDFTTLDVNDGAATNSTTGTASLVLAKAGTAGNAGVTIQGTNDVISTLNISTKDAKADQAGFTVTNAATLTVNLSGAGDFDIRKANTGKLTVDASEMTGALTVTTAANFLTITGGAGDDTFTAGDGLKSVIDGGAGTDTLTGAAAVDLTAATFTNFEVINTSSEMLSSQVNGLSIVIDDNAANSIVIGANEVDTNVIDASGINFLDTAGDGINMASVGDLATQLTSKVTADSAMTITGSNGKDVLVGFGGKDTISGGKGVDDLDGKAGDDTLDGGDGDDTITGGAGDDTMTGGKGTDIFEIGEAGESTVMSASNDASAASGVFAASAVIAAGDTFTFANGVDVVKDFTQSTDDIQGDAAAGTAPTSGLLAYDTDLVDNTSYVMYGSWDGSTFTVASAFDATSANDALYVEGDGGALTFLTTTGYAVLEDLTAALDGTNFV